MNNPVPVGTVISYLGVAPEKLTDDGWLICDGSSVSTDDYPDLWAAIQYTYGSSGDDLFNLPDLRGMFLRGVDAKGVVDPDGASRTSPIPGNDKPAGAVVGSRQSHQVHNHQHNWDQNFGNITWSGDDLHVQLALGSPHTSGDLGTQPTTNVDGGGNETRPSNVYAYYLIFAGSDSQAR